MDASVLAIGLCLKLMVSAVESCDNAPTHIQAAGYASCQQSAAYSTASRQSDIRPINWNIYSERAIVDISA